MRRPTLAGALVGVALFVIVGLGAHLRFESSQSKYKPHRYQQSDVHRYYVSPADSLLAGRGWETDYGQNFIAPPLQGVFVALVKGLNPSASYGMIRRVQAWIGALGILLAFQVGREMGGRWVGLLAAGFFAFDPHVVKAAESLLTETSYFTLLFGFLAVLLRALDRDSPWLFASAGALLGLTSLMKPFPTLLAVLLPVYFVVRGRSWKSAGRGALLLALFATVVAPWIARNYLRYDAIFPISTNAGTALAMANYLDLDASKVIYWEQIQASGKWQSPAVERRFAWKRDADGKLMWNERDRAYRQHAIAYIADHPLHFAHNYAIKLYNVFRYPLGRSGAPWRTEDVYRVALMALGFLGLAGFAATQHARPAWVVVWIFLYYAAFAALFHITLSGRLNLPVKVLLGFFAAWLLVEGTRRVFAYSRPRATPPRSSASPG